MPSEPSHFAVITANPANFPSVKVTADEETKLLVSEMMLYRLMNKEHYNHVGDTMHEMVAI